MLVWHVSCQDQRPTQGASTGLPFIDWLRVPRTASKKRALLLLYFEENTNASFRIPFLLSQLQMPGGYRLNFTHFSENEPLPDNRVGRFLRWVLLGLSRSHSVRHDLRLSPEWSRRSI